MYEKLIKQMRFCAEDHSVVECQDKCPNFGNYRPFEYCFSKLIAESADAIEATSKAYQMMAEAYEAEVTKSRWIPVTERLPDAASGDVSERVLVTDGKDVVIAEWFNFEECEPFWSYTGFGKDVTHWMPLPPPPEEMFTDSNQVKEEE